MTYDEWLEAPYMRQDDEFEDEGVAILQSAMAHLKPRADADEDAQEIGDFEAYEILSECVRKRMHDYECRFCGEPMPKPDRYCSAQCYKADSEGW